MPALALLWMLLLATSGCGGADEGAASPAQGVLEKKITDVLQFVPAIEVEYPRQEAKLRESSAHYRLRRAKLVSGTLTSADGALLNGYLRFAGATAEGKVDPASIRLKEVSVEAGEFILELVPGDYVVDIVPDSPGWPAQRQFVTVADEKQTLDLICGEGVIYSGVVSDATGTPIHGATVRSISEEGVSSASVSTGVDGSYSIAVGPDATKRYQLEFAVPESAYPRIIFAGLSAQAPRSMDVRFLPVSFVTVTGKVVSKQDGAAAEGATVALVGGPSIRAATWVQTGDENSSGEAVYRAKSDAGGNFSIKVAIGDWEYDLAVQPSLDKAYGGIRIKNFTPGSSSPTIELPQKRRVEGRVTDELGEPVGFAEVVIVKTISFDDSQQVVRTYADEGGVFESLLDPSGSFYNVTVNPLRGSFARCSRTAVDLDSFNNAFIVNRGKTTEGFVADASGIPLPRVAVTLVSTSTVDSNPVRVVAESVAPTDADGHFTIVVPEDRTASGCRGGVASAPRLD